MFFSFVDGHGAPVEDLWGRKPTVVRKHHRHNRTCSQNDKSNGPLHTWYGRLWLLIIDQDFKACCRFNLMLNQPTQYNHKGLYRRPHINQRQDKTHPMAHEVAALHHPATHLLCHWPSASCYLSDKFNMLSPWCEIPVRVTCKATSVCLLLRATYVLLATLVSGHQQAPFPGQLVDWGMAADSPCWAAMSRKFCLFRLKSSKFQAFLEPTF